MRLVLKDILGCTFSGDGYLQVKRSVHLKWVKDLNIRPESIKLLEENTGSCGETSWHPSGNNFLDDTKKQKAISGTALNLKSFCTAK